MNELKYDHVIKLAKNKKGDTISACRFGKIWVYVYKGAGEAGEKIGLAYNSKYLILEKSSDYILSQCGYNFSSDDLLLIDDKKMVFLTFDQIESIKKSILLLDDCESESTKEIVHHLKKSIA